MKKLIAIIICFTVVFSLAGCGNTATSNVKIDYGTSSIYSEDDMNAAIEIIKDQINSWEGCELHSLSYSS